MPREEVTFLSCLAISQRRRVANSVSFLSSAFTLYTKTTITRVEWSRREIAEAASIYDVCRVGCGGYGAGLRNAGSLWTNSIYFEDKQEGGGQKIPKCCERHIRKPPNRTQRENEEGGEETRDGDRIMAN